jgi:hypothetical protein
VSTIAVPLSVYAKNSGNIAEFYYANNESVKIQPVQAMEESFGKANKTFDSSNTKQQQQQLFLIIVIV